MPSKAVAGSAQNKRNSTNAAASPAASAFAISWEERIGSQIRHIRQKKRITLDELAALTKLTKGQLSRIENGRVSSPVSTLTRIAAALGVSPAEFFSLGAEGRRTLHCKKGGGRPIVGRGSKLGHAYESLIFDLPFANHFECYLMTIEKPNLRKAKFTFRHPGQELLYMLEGCMTYQVGEEDYTLEPGDSLFFEGSTPHGPTEVSSPPARFLSIISNTES